jgi:hypothetical protein
MDTELRQQPVANERADESDQQVADQAKSTTLITLPASQPATIPTTTIMSRLWFDKYKTVPPPFAL